MYITVERMVWSTCTQKMGRLSLMESKVRKEVKASALCALTEKHTLFN